MTIPEARARVRVAISRLEANRDLPDMGLVISEAAETLEAIQTGRYGEAEVVKDLGKLASRLNQYADEIAGIRGRMNA